MQFRLASYQSKDDGSLEMNISSGQAFDVKVLRTNDGTFICYSNACIWAHRIHNCEHINVAKEVYENEISHKEERRVEKERQAVLAQIQKAQAELAKLEAQCPREPDVQPTLATGYRRAIKI